MLCSRVVRVNFVAKKGSPYLYVIRNSLLIKMVPRTFLPTLFVASGAYEKSKYGKVFHVRCVQFVISRHQHFLQFRKPHVSGSGLELVRMAALGNLRQRSEIDFYF